MPSVDDLISDLRNEGEVVSEGRFTLDRDKAREKMRQFQLADPRAYVLELVQAAVLKGAAEIAFDIDADDSFSLYEQTRHFRIDANFSPRIGSLSRHLKIEEGSIKKPYPFPLERIPLDRLAHIEQ